MISIKCGLNTFLKWKGNPKIWVVGLFLIFYVYNLTAPIVKGSKLCSESVAFPIFLFQSNNSPAFYAGICALSM